MSYQLNACLKGVFYSVNQKCRPSSHTLRTYIHMSTRAYTLLPINTDSTQKHRERERERRDISSCTAGESSAVGVGDSEGERAATDLNVEVGSGQRLQVESGQPLEVEAGQQLQLELVQGQASVAVEEGEEGEGGGWEGEGEGEGEGQRGGEEGEGGEGGEEGEGESLKIEEEVSVGVEVNVLMYSVKVKSAVTISQERTFAGKPLPLIDLLPRPHLSPTTQLLKYWSQRYRLFSRYDNGICLDRGTCIASYDITELLTSWIAAHMHSSQINNNINDLVVFRTEVVH